MAQQHDIRLWSAAVATAIALAGCGGDRPGNAGDVGRTGDSAAPADTVAAVPPDTVPALPGGTESTPGASGPGTGVARPTPSPADSDTAARAGRATTDDRRTATTTRRPADSARAKPPAPPRKDTAAAAAAPGAVADQKAQTNAAEQGKPSPPPTSPSPPPEQGLRDEYHRAPRDTVDQVTYEGWKQYNLNCARCHGEDVLGTTMAPHLIQSVKPNGPINTQEAFTQVVCAGRKEKGMPGWCELGLGMDKIQAIYAYVKGRSEGKIGPGRPAVRQSS